VAFGPLAAALVALVALAATVIPSHRASAAGADLPPPTLAALQRRFDPQVKALGLRVSRGMLQNLQTYEEDPEGTHLALYVEPIKPGYTNAQYLENFTKLTHLLVPAVFERWKGLESFDICQEPVDDPRAVPPPVTQIFVERDSLDRVSGWRRASLTQLLAASPRVRSVAAGYYVYFAPSLRDEPTFLDAAAEAGWTTGSTAFGH
jgi:hypothetical protein